MRWGFWQEIFKACDLLTAIRWNHLTAASPKENSKLKRWRGTSCSGSHRTETQLPLNLGGSHRSWRCGIFHSAVLQRLGCNGRETWGIHEQSEAFMNRRLMNYSKLKFNALAHSFSRYLLCLCTVPGTVTGPGIDAEKRLSWAPGS